MKKKLAIVVAVLVGVNLTLFLIDKVLPSPSGERSSALATTPDGFAAWASLAEKNGIEVVVLRESLNEAELEGTVVALDVPNLKRSEARVLREHGDVIVGGQHPERWLDVFDPDLRRSRDGTWSNGEPIVRRGEATLLADASRLHNENLARGDNAAFALELAGDGPLIFAEAPHGYTEASGLAALPDSAKWCLGLLFAAALLLMLARGRRFGPPEKDARPLEPARAEYVDAMAALLARADKPRYSKDR